MFHQGKENTGKVRNYEGNCVYSLDGWAESGEASVGIQEKESLAQVWRKRLGHISEADFHELERREVLRIKGLGKLEFCEECVLGKQTRLSFGQGERDSKTFDSCRNSATEWSSRTIEPDALEQDDRKDVVFEVDLQVSGLVIYMFVDKKYPVTVKLMERMLDYQLEIGHGAVGNELTTAVQLVKFLKKQIADSKRAGVHDWYH
ncbi:retrovirus-related pol polyprotein from transposon TNT 1-94 [Tanacetum coccineum]